MRQRLAAAPLLLSVLSCLCPSAIAADIYAAPSDYKAKLTELRPGDTLYLAPGEYTRNLNLTGLHGRAGEPITITGPQAGQAVFGATSGANTVNLQDASYLVIRRLVLDGRGKVVDAIKAGGRERLPVHNITIEYCKIIGYGAAREVVAINTKAPAWDWVVRGNTIIAPGTGMYFGNSDGTQPFVRGIIENNLVTDAKGYCLQIKHQVSRPVLAGMPTGPSATIIRYNTFTKSAATEQRDGRPNVLIGGLPDDGPGSKDQYHVYGNVLFHNHTDSLFQGAGRISLHDNLLVDCAYYAINFRSHEGKQPKSIRVYHNSMLAVLDGIRVSDMAEGGEKLIAANLTASKVGPDELRIDSDGNAEINTSAAATIFACADPMLGRCDLQPIKRIDAPLPMGFLGMVGEDDCWYLDFTGSRKPNAAYAGAFAKPLEQPRPIEATTRPAVKPPNPWD